MHFDAAYFCDLAADVEVYQFEAIGHLGFSKKSRASNNSLELSPNLLPSPPLSSHLPLPELASLMRIPMFGRIFKRLEISAMRRSSFSFSTTRKMRRPIF